MVRDAAVALGHAVAEIDAYVGSEGWDRPPRLFALVPVDEFMRAEPAVASARGLQDDGSYTLVEQELDPAQSLDDVLAGLWWPAAVAGAALSLEAVMGSTDDGSTVTLEKRERAEILADPERTEVRVTAGVLREGRRRVLLRMRGVAQTLEHDDLAPDLTDALQRGFAPP